MTKRLASLDAFRGFAVAAMVLVNNPGSWKHVHAPLEHAAWNGCTFTDLIFPFFLFAAGLAMTLSLASRSGGAPAVYRILLRRAAIIFLIGLGLNLIPAFDPATVRVPGVLQRIALALALGGPVVLWGRARAAVAAILGLCALWLVLELAVPVPGADGAVAAGRLMPGMDFGAWLDRLVLPGHLWAHARTWDPEGLVGTLTATATLLLGSLAGRHLAAPGGRRPKWAGLLLAGAALLALGWVLGRALPLNKSLWTPTFVLFTGGWALLGLAACHAALDEAPAGFRETARKACLPLTIFGMNALFLFVVSGVAARAIQTIRAGGAPLKERAFTALAALPIAPENASLLFAVLFDLALFALAWAMWRKKWFVKV